MHVHTVDLFCGCGGLGLGFQLAKGNLSFDVVMGLDNDPAPLKVYNDNHPSSAKLSTGRLCDLTWFSHPSEFLLYYLNHFSWHKSDAALRDALNAAPVSFSDFLGNIAYVDNEFAVRVQSITESPAYQKDCRLIAPKTLTTAICQSFFDTVRIDRPSARGGLQPGLLPWAEEVAAFASAPHAELPAIDNVIAGHIREQLKATWNRELEHLRSSSQKQGRGANASIAVRVRSLVAFLESETGRLLGDEWLKWRTTRDSLRAAMCASAAATLRLLYDDGRRVGLVLGGPPCKGFSRIGRPVAVSLHDQGTFSWSSGEFGDERNSLFHQYVLVVSALRPDAFVFENVENFTAPLKHANNMDPPALLEEAIENLSEESLHFTVRSELIRAVEHCVPQTRIRFFMVGLNLASLGEVPSLSPLDLPRCGVSVPLEVALRGLGEAGEFIFADTDESADASHEASSYAAEDPAAPKSHKLYWQWIRQVDSSGEAPCVTDAHVFRQLRVDDLEMVKRFGAGQRWMDYTARSSETVTRLRVVLSRVKELLATRGDITAPELAEVEELLGRCDKSLLLRLLAECAELPLGNENHLLKSNYLSNGTGKHGDWFERLSPAKPCKTIVAHIGKDTYGYFHPSLPRALTMRETARVQTFPDWFHFRQAGIVQGYAMIGNAVPPLLANHLAVHLTSMHEKCQIFSEGSAETQRRKPVPKALRRRVRQQSLTFARPGISTTSDQ
jgi:site-specific DNA-cytosine methylase